MQLPQNDSQKSPSLRAGFTLVEMLVIAPLVLIIIAGIIAAMVSLIGDTLVSNARVDDAYNMQETLNQIEQDIRISTNFMGTFSYFQSPQGRNGATQAFTSSSSDLILTQQATTTSPYDANRDLVYYAKQPEACGSTTVQSNRALNLRVIYFVDANKTLWRRTIVNDWNRNGTIDGNTVCNVPYQRSSCPTGSTTSTNTILKPTCQTIDQRMIDNVTNFNLAFYTSSDTATVDPTAANT